MFFGGQRRTARTSYTWYRRQTGGTRSELLFLCSLALMVYANLVHLSSSRLAGQVALMPTAYAAKANSSIPANSTAPRAQTAAAPDPTSDASTAAAQTAQISTPQACTGSDYTQPSALPLGNLADGLNAVVDTPAYYQVYGDSVAELRDAIENCPLRAKVGAYHAVTTYQLNWSYTPTVSNGVCSMHNVRVGLHVNQYLPLFTPSPSTPVSATAAWNAYYTSLKAHEDEHASIDREYAQQLATALQNIGSLDCTTFATQVKTTIDSYVTMLNTANELYDATTNHGATQGATL